MLRVRQLNLSRARIERKSGLTQSSRPPAPRKAGKRLNPQCITRARVGVESFQKKGNRKAAMGAIGDSLEPLKNAGCTHARANTHTHQPITTLGAP